MYQVSQRRSGDPPPPPLNLINCDLNEKTGPVVTVKETSERV